MRVLAIFGFIWMVRDTKSLSDFERMKMYNDFFAEWRSELSIKETV